MEDFIKIAKILGVKRTTSYGIANRGSSINSHGGARYRKLDGDALAFSITCLEENPLLTLKDLLYKIRQHFPEKPQFTYQTLARALEGQSRTLKLMWMNPYKDFGFE